MSYSFLDGSGTLQNADSSIISGVIQRPVVQIGSVLQILPISQANYPGTFLSYTGSVVSGSVTAIFTSVAGVRNYLTDITLANTGSVATLVTLKDGSTSVLGYFVVPAANTTSRTYDLGPRPAIAQDLTFSANPSSSVLYVTARGYQV